MTHGPPTDLMSGHAAQKIDASSTTPPANSATAIEGLRDFLGTALRAGQSNTIVNMGAGAFN